MMEQTQISFNFSVQIKTDREDEIIKALFLLFTLPLALFWWIKQRISRFNLKLAFLVMDVQELLTFIGKVLAIHIKAYAFGLGVMT